MPRYKAVQSRFTEGQVSPRFQGLVDEPTYGAALKTLKNWVVLPQGSVTRRPGTYYAGTTKDNNQAKLIPFNFGAGDSYVLEFGNQYIRFFKNGAPLYVTSTTNAYEITANIPWNASQLNDISFTQSADVVFLAHPDYKPRKLTRTADTSTGGRAADDTVWAVTELDLEDGPWGDVNTTDTTMYADDFGSNTASSVTLGKGYVDLTENWVQIKNHGLLDGQLITVSDSANGSSGSVHPKNSTNYYVVNATANTFQLSEDTTSGVPDPPVDFTGTDTEITITTKIFKKDDEVEINASGAYFDITGSTTTEEVYGEGSTTHYGSSKDIGKLLRINPLTSDQIKWGYMKITHVISTTVAVGIVQKDIVSYGSDSASKEWRVSPWNDTDGWPRTVDIYQQRLCFAGSALYPQTIWFSKSGDFYNFAPTETEGIGSSDFTSTGARIVADQILDDNAITLTIDSDTVDRINWMMAGKKLSLGTTGGVFNLYGTETSYTLTPFNFTIEKATSFEVANETNPLQIDQNLLFIQRGKRIIREIPFTVQEQGQKTLDVTIRSEDITLSGVKRLVHQQQPYHLVWGLLTNGKLIAMTYVSQFNMFAWSTHEIGGTFNGTDSNIAVVEDITSIPTSTHDQVWMIVKRTIGGSTKRYIEYLERFYDQNDIAETKAHYVDSGLELDQTIQASSTDITLSSVSSSVMTFSAAHGLSAGDKVGFESTRDLPTGLQTDKIYYVLSLSLTSTAFKVATKPEFTDATCDTDHSAGTGTTFGTNPKIIRMDNTSAIKAGMRVTGTGIPASATVSEVNSVTLFTLSADTTATNSNQTLTFWTDDVTVSDTGNGTVTTLEYTTSITNLGHLEGLSVDILGQAAVQPSKTVASSSITLTTDVTRARVGLGYVSDLETLPLAREENLYMLGAKTRLHQVSVKLLESMGLEIGTDASGLDEVIFRQGSDAAGEAVPLFSGVKVFRIGNQTFDDGTVLIRVSNPFPATLLFIGIDYSSNDLRE